MFVVAELHVIRTTEAAFFFSFYFNTTENIPELDLYFGESSAVFLLKNQQDLSFHFNRTFLR